MLGLLFSPSGRINSAEFMKGVTVLIIISLAISFITLLSPVLGMTLGIISLVLIWCWVVLWVKRYHDGGKSGWMCLIPIIVYLVVSMIFGMIIGGMFQDPAYQAAIEDATASGDFGAIMQAAVSGGGGMTMVGQIIAAVGGAIIAYIIAMLFNNMIKHEPHENQYGPA